MKNHSYNLSNSSDGIGKLMRILSLTLFILCSAAVANAQYVNIPVTGFNNDIVANGTGPGTAGSMPGVTYPLIGVDGNLPAAFSFIDNTFLWSATSVSPTCFLPENKQAPSLLTAGLTYVLQDYGTLALNNNNALTIDNNSTTYTTSPFPNSATLTLTTPASYLSLNVLYETVVNVAPLSVDVTVTFTDNSTQTFNGNNCVNWFTNTGTAYTNISRAGNQGGTPATCPGGPYLFELSLPLSSANFSKLVQSITFSIPTTFTVGTNSASVNYFHALAVGGQIGCSAPLSGNYTINNFAVTGGTNFSSFSDFAAALSCGGVSGPVVADVDLSSGPYDEQVDFKQIPGASAINTITINGNNRRLTKTLAGGANYATMNLSGADYMIVNNLRIDALGAVGFGIHLMNRSDYNTFSNCTVNITPNTTSSLNIGISISGSATSYSFSGINGSNNLFTGCTVNGGYMGIVFYGDGVSYLNNFNNSIVNCTVQDYYLYGSYNYYQGGSTISRNIFQRPTRSSGTLTTGYGVMLTTGCTDILVEKNRVRNMFGTNPATTSTVYGLYVSTTATPGLENKVYNNLVYDIFSNGNIFGIYLSGANGVKVYHNTVALNHPASSGASTTTYGIYGPSANASIANNNIFINRGGTASMFGLYYPSLVSFSNYNNVYLQTGYTSAPGASSAGTVITVASTAGITTGMTLSVTGGTGAFAAGTTVSSFTATTITASSAPTTALSGAAVVTGATTVRYFGYNGSNQLTFTNWKTANPLYDQQSTNVNPNFTDPLTGDFTPTNNAMNSIGKGFGVGNDIIGAIRSAQFPDPGAYEFTPQGLDAAIQWVGPVTPVAVGTYSISVLVANTMTIPITDLSLTYTNGVTPVTEIFTGLNIGSGGSQTLTFSVPFNLAGTVTLSASIDNVNGIADDAAGNNSTSINLCTSLSGNYTLNSAVATGGTNFQTYAALLSALNCGGILGPVVIDVAPGSGPYNEQVAFLQIAGASAVNTFTINGNGTTLSFNATSSTAPHTLMLNGTDWMTINNLNVVGTNASNALVVHLWNQANNNTFLNCTFTCTANGTSSITAPFSLSCSATSATTTGGLSGNNNILNGCTLNNGYYGITLVGSSNASPNTGIEVINCIVKDQYLYGIYTSFLLGAKISGNLLERPTRTSITTEYGIYMTTGTRDILVEKNKIRRPFDAVLTTTNTFYALYYVVSDGVAGLENKIYNNVISDMKSAGPLYGFYAPSSSYSHWRLAHNTFSFDETSATGTTTVYGVYVLSNTNTEVRNNIISIRRGGGGVKTCYYYSPNPTISNHNVVQILPGATNFVKYDGTTGLKSLAEWQLANPSMDQQSKSANPSFISAGSPAYDYTPSAGTINNICPNVGVNSDIAGSVRGASPDPGAYEFTPQPLDALLGWVSPGSAPFTPGNNTITVSIINNGSSTITSASITYTDGVTPVTEVFSGLNIPLGGTQNVSFATPYNLTGTATITATLTLLNGLADADPNNNVVTQFLCVPYNGVYTINSAVATGGTNFQTFAAAVSNLASCGISGPVIFNVDAASGPYVEQIEFPVVGGTSAVNTITFNGNGRTLQFTPVSSYPTLRLTGVDWTIWNNMNFATLGTTNGFAGQLSGQSDNNSFNNCSFTVPITTTSSTTSALNFSAINTSPTGSGQNGSNNTFTGCTFTGGYYCVAMYGNTASETSPTNNNNKFFNCLMTDYYIYGMYHGYSTNTVVSGCTFERPNRVSASLSTGYGVYFFGYQTNAALIEKNKIRNLFAQGASNNTNSGYGIYIGSNGMLGNEYKIYNNVITNIAANAGFTAGIYCFGSFTNIYNNTISYSYPAFASTTSAYGIYVSASSPVNIKNNIVNLGFNGGTSIKSCLYFFTPANYIVSCNNNDLFNSSTSGTNLIAYDGTTNFTTLAAWQGAYPQYDNLSYSVNPNFVNPAGNNFSPQAFNLDNTAEPVGLLVDVNNAPRSASAPDIGAYEVTMAPTADFAPVSLVVPSNSGCYSSTQSVVVKIKNIGNYTHDFSVTPVTITCNVSGTTIATLTGTASGTLASQQTMDVTLTGTFDMNPLGSYSFALSTSVAGDANAANNNFAISRTRVALEPGVVSTLKDKICEGAPTLTLTGNAGGSLQWRQSTAGPGGPWTPVGTGTTSYTPAAPQTVTTYYQVLASCLGSDLASNIQTVEYNLPTLINAAGDTRCGVGPVTLTATADPLSNVDWYTAQTGGVAVYTGSNYTIPDLAATTDYYVSASFGGNVNTVGVPAATQPWYSYYNGGYGIIFDCYSPFKLRSVDVYAITATNGATATITVALQNSLGQTLATKTVSVIGTTSPPSAASKNTVFLGIDVPVGSQLRLTLISSSNLSGLQYDCGVGSNCSTNFYAAPYAYQVPGVMKQLGGHLGSATYYNYYANYFYNWSISTGCETPRSKVTATFNPAPLITASTASPAVCPGSTAQLSIATSGNPAYTYNWTPGNLSGSSVDVAPSVYTVYTAIATDNTAGPYAGCQAQATVTVSTKPKVSVITSANPVDICSGQGSQLGVAGSTTVSYAMAAATPQPIATPPSGVTILDKTNFPGNIGGLDDGYFPVTLPFEFSFYGVTHNKINLNTNGYLTFINGFSGIPSNASVILPHTGDMNNAIYLAWKDWDLSVSGSIQYFTVGSAPHRIFVIKYVDVPPFVSTPPYAGTKFSGQIEMSEDNGKIALFIAQTDGSNIKTLGIENPLGIGAYAPSARNGEAWQVVSPEQWEFTPIGGSMSYNWTPAANLDNPTSTSPTASFIFATTVFTATVVDAAGGCTGSDQITLATGDPLTAVINSTEPTLCEGNSATLSTIPDGGCAPYTYQWSDGATVISTGGFISVTPSTSTNYTLTVTDGAGTEKVTNFFMLVKPLPTVTATNGLVCGTGSATLTASGNAVSYTWSPSNFLNTTTGTSVISTPGATIVYTVTGVSALGCPKTALSTMTKSFVTVVTAGASLTAVPMNGSTQLNAVGSLVNPGYEVTSVPHFSRNQTILPNDGPIGDEGNTNAPLGFTFNFFGTSYTDVTIHTNGQILMGANRTEANSIYYPNSNHTNLPNVAQPNNWVGFWADLSPTTGQIKWGTVGSAPARKFIARWTNANWFSTGPTPINYQIELTEGSNAIDVFISGMSGGTNTTSHSRLIGMENQTGTLGTVAPERTPAYGYWTTGDEGWHFQMVDTAMTYSWTPSTFLDDNTLYSPVASNMTATTTYEVTATNTKGCTGTNSIQIEVGVPLAVTTATSVNDFCELSSTLLSSTPTGGCQPYSYSWSDGTTEIGTTKNKTIAPPSGITTYTLTVTDACGATATSSVAVTVKPAPPVTATKSGDICGTVPVSLTAAGAVSYAWSPTVGLNSGTNTVVTCSATSTTSYTLTGTGANGCTRPVPLLVNVYPAVVANPTATPPVVCANGTSQLKTNPATEAGYTVASIPFSGRDLTAVSGVGGGTGDEPITSMPLGFNFVFCGNTYTGVTLHGNGQILMGLANSTAVGVYSPPSTGIPSAAAPNNWLGYWVDQNTDNTSQISWGVVGTAPNRKLIVRANAVNYYSATPANTYQYELNETTNSFDVYIINNATTSTLARQIGLENSTGTYGIYPTGRNYGTWTTANEGWRFTPIIPNLQYSWTPALNLDDVSIADPTATNITATQTYTATVTNTATGCSGTRTVTVTTGVPLVATATMKFPTRCSGDDDSLFVAVTGGRAPYTYSWSDGTNVLGTTQKIKVNPLVTTTYEVTVTDFCGIVTTSAPVSINVNPLPVLAVTPPGGSICNGLPSTVTMTASGADTYAWSPALGLDVNSGATVVASPSATIAYTVLGTNTTTTCKNTISITLNRTEFLSGGSLASPSLVCASQPSQLTSIFSVKTNPALLITEVTQFGAGSSGATTPRPSYFAASDDDFVEISNLSSAPLSVGGLEFQLWSGTALNRAYFIPAGTVIAGHKTLVLHIGAGTNNPANGYYHTGGSNDPLTSSNGYGYILLSGGSILDAVATTSSTGDPYAWPLASGVTAAHWSGTIPFVSTTSVGVIRTGGFDSNVASDWVYASNALRQSEGTYNPFYGSNTQPDFTYSWSNAGFLDDATLQNPVASGYTGGLENFIATATDPASGCSWTAATSVNVLPLPTVALSTSAATDVCAGTAATLIFNFTGVGPWNYSYTDGTNTFALTSSTPTATVTPVPPGVANDVVTYTPVSISDTRCDGEASSMSGSVTVSLKSYSSISGITLTTNKPFNNICTGDNITLSLNDVTPGSLGYNAHWKWYSGPTASTPVPGSTDALSITVNPTVTTMYHVRAEGYCNNTAYLTKEVTVSTAPPSANPGLAYSPAITFPGGTDSLVINPVPGATFYRWTTNGNAALLFDGQPAPYETSSPKVMVTFVSPTTQGQGVGSYHLSFVAGNACGRTNQNNVHIRGTVSPVSSITGPRVACAGQTKVYTAAATVGAKTYDWSFASGSGTISGNGTATVSVTFTSVPAVLCVHGVTAFNSSGPDVCITVSGITETPGPISGNAVPCRGGLETYTVGAVDGATSYTWSCSVAGSIVTPNGLSANVQFPAGIFSGNVSVVANSGCGTSTASQLAVVSGTTPPLGTITGTAFGVCNATSVNYQVPSIGATTYLWTVPSGATIVAGDGTNSILVDFDGTFAGGSIDVSATNVCGSVTGSFDVVGAPAPPVITGTALVCEDQDEGYTASSPGATSYSWTVNASESEIITTSATGDQALIHWLTNGGTIWAVATNDCGSSLPGAYVVGSSCRISGNESLVEILQAIVFPNPSQGRLTLQYHSPEQTDFLMNITDVTGRQVQRESLQAFEGLNRHEVNLGQVSKGIYMLSLENKAGEKVIIRLVIE